MEAAEFASTAKKSHRPLSSVICPAQSNTYFMKMRREFHECPIRKSLLQCMAREMDLLPATGSFMHLEEIV